MSAHSANKSLHRTLSVAFTEDDKRPDIFVRKPESSIAPYLTELQARTKADGIRVGSYPLLQAGVYVSLIGQDQEVVKALAEDAAKALDGRLVSDEEAREMARQKEKGAA